MERRAVHCLSEDCFIVERGLLREKLQLSFCCSRLRCHAIPQNAATYPTFVSGPRENQYALLSSDSQTKEKVAEDSLPALTLHELRDHLFWFALL